MGFWSRIWGSDESEELENEQILETKNIDTGINLYNKPKKEGKQVMVKYALISPKNFEDSKKVLDIIKKNMIVTFSIEYLSREEGQRMIDIVSGASNALNARLVPLNERVYTSVPLGIEIEDYAGMEIED